MNATTNAIGRLDHTVLAVADLAVADLAWTIAFHGRVPDVRRFESSEGRVALAFDACDLLSRNR